MLVAGPHLDVSAGSSADGGTPWLEGWSCESAWGLLGQGIPGHGAPVLSGGLPGRGRVSAAPGLCVDLHLLSPHSCDSDSLPGGSAAPWGSGGALLGRKPCREACQGWGMTWLFWGGAGGGRGALGKGGDWTQNPRRTCSWRKKSLCPSLKQTGAVCRYMSSSAVLLQCVKQGFDMKNAKSNV